MSTPWWKTSQFSDLGQGWLDQRYCLQGVQQAAFENKQTSYNVNVQGSLKGCTFEELCKAIHEIWPNGWIVAHELSNGGVVKDVTQVWIDDDSYLYLYFDGDGLVNASFASTNKEWMDRVLGFMNERVERKPASGRAYVMVSTPHGISFQSVGVAAIPFEAENYPTRVVEDYEHVASDLKTVSPCGRVVVLNGLPGTGKTFLVRGLMNDCPDATFVLIQAHLVASLADPQLVSAIINLKRNRPEGPIVFVIEDADECLASRASDNIASISAILNFGDGILGSMLDFRIVATTNAKAEDLDPAIVRPGRLCRRIDIGSLKRSQAEAVHQRLTGKPLPETLSRVDSFTLAEIYKIAREGGWQPPKTSKGLGFNNKYAIDPDDY